ncbi:MAG: Hsp20/alpha crystallin family protein [Tissierellia bacterium]|nr:Hsp20/alpha crystallin family protein [Tissierellia bacterium]
MNFYNNIFDDFFEYEQRNNDLKIDIKKIEKGYEIVAAVAGVKKDDISINLDNDILTISVDQKDDEDKKNDNYIFREIQNKKLKRKIQLNGMKIDNIEASLDNGLLTIKLYEKAVEENKKIEIK